MKDGGQAKTTRDVPGLTLRALVVPGSVDREKRTVEITWTTGARVRRGFWEPFDEDLSLDPKHVRMGRLQSGAAPLVDSHSINSLRTVLGVVDRASIGAATVRFSKRADVEPIFNDVADGIIRNVSVGYFVHQYERQPKADGDAVPVYTAVDWEPYELSFVPVGADAGAGTRSAEAGPTMPGVFVSRSEEITMDPKTATVPAAPVTPPPAPAPVAPVDDATVRAAEGRAVQLERERAAGIRVAVRAAKLDEKTAEEMIANGVTLDAARAQVLEQLARKSDATPTDPHVRVEITDDASDKWRRGAGAWLLERSGFAGMVRQAAKEGKVPGLDKVELDPGEFRGLSLLDLARESLENAGVKTRGLQKMDLAGRAFTMGRSGLAGTTDFPVLLEDVLHRVLLAAYATQSDTWRRFCGTRTVSDFRAHNFFRTGSFGVLDSKNEHGEFKQKSIPDGQKTAITVATKGNIIGITRETIINDDMGALTDLLQKLGRAAALTIEVDVYALLALNGGLGPTQSDAQPFFHSNRANVNASATAHTVAGWDADRVVMAQQRDTSSNEYLNLRPAILLVAAGQRAAAQVLNASLTDPNATTNANKPNAVVGQYRDIIDTPRISGTRRYAFADPSIAPAIIVAFLEGSGEAPVLETMSGWRVDGTEMKVRADFLAQMFDSKGAVTNAGA